MKTINSNRQDSIDVNCIRRTIKKSYTEFVYVCKCGRKHFDVYVAKGTIGVKNKVCKDCKDECEE